MRRRKGGLFALALLLCLHLAAVSGESEDGGDAANAEASVDTTQKYEPMDAGTVIELSAVTVKQAMQAHKFLLVEFYAPWCGHCKTLEPEYKQAAKELEDADADLRLAKVDVTRNPSVQADYGVAGFPTLKWFVDGKLSRLDVQARTSDALVSFCTKNTDGGPVTSTERLKAYLDQYPFVAVAYVEEEEGEVFDALSEAEGDMEHLEFVYITSASIAADMDAKVPSIVFYVGNKDAAEAHVYDGPLVGDDVTEAIRRLSTEDVKILDDDNGDDILTEDRVAKVVLFRSAGEISNEFIVLKQVAQALKHRYNFFSVQDGTNERLTRFVGLETDSDPPKPWIYVFVVSKNKRFRFEGDMTAAGLSSFLQSYDQDELAPYLMSEKPKADDGSLVKTVVGSSFSDFIHQDKHVVVEFYTPWCGACRALELRYKLTAEYLEAKYPGEFVFGKIDGSKNEVGDDNQIQGFPTVWLYPKGKKGPPFPIDLSKESGDVHLFVKSLRLACEKPKETRSQEAEYVAAARRFKAAVRALEGSMGPAVKELNDAAARLEKLVAGKSEL